MSHPHVNTWIRLDEHALSSLARALRLPRQRFSLIVARCTPSNRRTEIRTQALNVLQQDYSITIETLALKKTATNLYTEIQTIQSLHPLSNLSVIGLETVDHVDELLSSANRMRDRFRQSFPFPVILWVDDAVLNRLVRLAPDFYNWAGTPIVFDGQLPDAQNDSSLLKV